MCKCSRMSFEEGRMEEERDLFAASTSDHTQPATTTPCTSSLCKLHHAAFDQNLMGIRPDVVIELSTTVLKEIDGPMLIHGLQGFHGACLVRRRGLTCIPTPNCWNNATSCSVAPGDLLRSRSSPEPLEQSTQS